MNRITVGLVALAAASLISAGLSVTGIVDASSPNNEAGGTVTDAAPSFSGFVGSRASAHNGGSVTERFEGSISDANGEHTMVGNKLTIVVTGPDGEEYKHTISADDVKTTTEPSKYKGGWKVWTGTENDGVLHFAFLYEYEEGAATGDYTFTPEYEHEFDSKTVVAKGTPVTRQVDEYAEVTIDSDPVGPDGEKLGERWGLWNAAPQSKNVESTNYLRIRNTGQKATSSITVDFTDKTLTGAKSKDVIPLDGNVKFSWCEVASISVAPSACAWNDGATSLTGTFTKAFSAKGNVMYVKYTLLDVGTVAADTYTASYTVDETA